MKESMGALSPQQGVAFDPFVQVGQELPKERINAQPKKCVDPFSSPILQKTGPEIHQSQLKNKCPESTQSRKTGRKRRFASALLDAKIKPVQSIAPNELVAIRVFKTRLRKWCVAEIKQPKESPERQ
jgi:hypothetical protein